MDIIIGKALKVGLKAAYKKGQQHLQQQAAERPDQGSSGQQPAYQNGQGQYSTYGGPQPGFQPPYTPQPGQQANYHQTAPEYNNYGPPPNQHPQSYHHHSSSQSYHSPQPSQNANYAPPQGQYGNYAAPPPPSAPQSSYPPPPNQQHQQHQQQPYFPPPPGQQTSPTPATGTFSYPPHSTQQVFSQPHTPLTPAASQQQHHYTPPPAQQQQQQQHQYTPSPTQQQQQQQHQYTPPPAQQQAQFTSPQPQQTSLIPETGTYSYPRHSISPLPTPAPQPSTTPQPPQPPPPYSRPPPEQTRDNSAVFAAVFEKLNLESNENERATTPQYGISDAHTAKIPTPFPPISARGPGSDVTRFCPESREVTYSLVWYEHVESGCLVCSRCYTDNIAPTHLASHFRSVRRPDGSSSTCHFFHPKVKNTLWPLALRTHNTTALGRFMMTRSAIPSCEGRFPSAENLANAQIRWFTLIAKDIPDFAACEACFEDYITGTPFESKFRPDRPSTPGSWVCDLCVPAIYGAAVKMAPTNDWAAFVSAGTRRLQLTSFCEGQATVARSQNWYAPSIKGRSSSMVVCEACYLDKLAYSEFAYAFAPRQPSGPASEQWFCDLASANLPAAFAIEYTLLQHNCNLLIELAETISRLPPCSAQGITGGRWWTIPGAPESFNVCEACFHGVFRAGGLEHFLEPRPSNATIVCNFCVTSPGITEGLSKFAEANDKGNFSVYTDYVMRLPVVPKPVPRAVSGSYPACPGKESRKGGRWWGYRDALFCEKCFHEFVEPTALGQSTDIKGVYDENIQICQMWSPRMRGMWTDLCSVASSPEYENSLNQFKAFAAGRQRVWAETIAVLGQMDKMKLLRARQAIHTARLGLQYTAMDGRAALSGVSDGYWHGSSSMGWYTTQEGVTGANMEASGRAQLANLNAPGDVQQRVNLQMRWKQVE